MYTTYLFWSLGTYIFIEENTENRMRDTCKNVGWLLRGLHLIQIQFSEGFEKLPQTDNSSF